MKENKIKYKKLIATTLSVSYYFVAIYIYKKIRK